VHVVISQGNRGNQRKRRLGQQKVIPDVTGAKQNLRSNECEDHRSQNGRHGLAQRSLKREPYQDAAKDQGENPYQALIGSGDSGAVEQGGNGCGMDFRAGQKRA